jgi:hypothetical protein
MTKRAMKHRLAPGLSLAIVLFAAATVALRAATRRPKPPPVSGKQDGARGDLAGPTDPAGQPASVVEQMQYVFHELHADGRNALCTVCDGQYEAA